MNGTSAPHFPLSPMSPIVSVSAGRAE
jgi:hypothetical protein